MVAVAAFTFKVAELENSLKVAVMVDVPIALPVARPLDAAAEERVATAVPPTGTFVAFSVAVAVTSFVEPLL